MNKALLEQITKVKQKLDRLYVQLTTGEVNGKLVDVMRYIDQNASNTGLAYEVCEMLNEIPGMKARFDIQEAIEELT